MSSLERRVGFGEEDEPQLYSYEVLAGAVARRWKSASHSPDQKLFVEIELNTIPAIRRAQGFREKGLTGQSEGLSVFHLRHRGSKP